MAYPDVEVSIARHALGPVVDPYDRGYVEYDATADAATYTFTAGDSLDLTTGWGATFDVQVPFLDPADHAGTNPTLVLAFIDDDGGDDLELGVIFNIGEASGTTVAVMYVSVVGSGIVYSDSVPVLDGINATPRRFTFDYADSAGTVTFSAGLHDGTEYAFITSAPTTIYGSATTPSRGSDGGTFQLLPNVTTNFTGTRLARARLPGTGETDFDDHDGTGTYNDGDRTWTVNNTSWRASDWEDVTDRTRFADTVTTNRGRTVDLGTYAPGTCGFVLDNADGTWDPATNTDLNPWRQVRVRATYDSTVHDVFYGYVRSYRPEYREAGLLPVVRVDAIDGFGLFANRSVGFTATTAALQLTPEGHWPQNEANNAEALDNAVFQQPDIDASWANHSRTSNPVFIGGRRHASFGPSMIIESEDLPSTWKDPTAWTVAAWLNLPSPTAPFLDGDRTNLLTVKNDSDDFWWSVYVENVSQRVWRGGIAVYNGSTNTYNDGPVLTDLVERWRPSDPTEEQYHHIAVTLQRGASTAAVWYLNGVAVGNHTLTNRTAPTGDAEMVNGDFDPATTLAIDTFDLTGSGAKNISHLTLWTRQVAAEELGWLADNNLDGFASERSDLRIGRILDWFGWPDWRRNLETGQVTLAEVDVNAGSALVAMQRVELSEFGDLFITPAGDVRFLDRDYRDDHSTTTVENFDAAATNAPYAAIGVSFDDELIVNVARLVGTNGAVLSRDLASIRSGYGHREFTRQVDTEVTQAQADTIVARYKEAEARPRSMTIRPTRDDARLFPEVLGRDITDKIGITIPVSATDPTLTARIARVSHVFNTEEWTTTWGLEAA